MTNKTVEYAFEDLEDNFDKEVLMPLKNLYDLFDNKYGVLDAQVRHGVNETQYVFEAIDPSDLERKVTLTISNLSKPFEENALYADIISVKSILTKEGFYEINEESAEIQFTPYTNEFKGFKVQETNLDKNNGSLSSILNDFKIKNGSYELFKSKKIENDFIGYSLN